MTQAREHPEKHLPALVVDGKEFLPAVALPLPLGGRSLKPGRDGEDDWADYAAEVLVPRWAVECIQHGLVLGQELEEDYDPDDGPFPVESMQDRVATILQTPGELDKWKRIVGWGIQVVRNLDEQTADNWTGGLMELLELGEEPPMPRWLCEAWRRRRADVIAVVYWASWAMDVWKIVEKAPGESTLDESSYNKAERLLAEANAHWEWHPIPSKRPQLRLVLGKHAWQNHDVTQMVKCLTELMSPPTNRTLKTREIQMIAEGNMAYYRVHAEKAEADVLKMAEIKRKQAEVAQQSEKAKELKNQLQKERKSKRARRKLKREAKTDRHFLGITNVIYSLNEGKTINETAQELGFSRSKVERLAAEARKRKLLEKRPSGRRTSKTVGEGDTIGGEGGEIEMNGECYRKWREARRKEAAIQDSEEDGDGME